MLVSMPSGRVAKALLTALAVRAVICMSSQVMCVGKGGLSSHLYGDSLLCSTVYGRAAVIFMGGVASLEFVWKKKKKKKLPSCVWEV